MKELDDTTIPKKIKMFCKQGKILIKIFTFIVTSLVGIYEAMH